MKSHVRDCLKLAYSVYKDACAHCATEISQRDLFKIQSRVKQEGISFLTITLPAFCRDFERSLDEGRIDPSTFRSFKKVGSIPVFLQGMIGRLFNRETGRINDVEIFNSPNSAARIIASVRQICLAFKKVELPCTPEREFKAMANFIAIERSFEMFTLPREEIKRFSLVSSVLWDPIVGVIHLDDLVPRHGPGATSERISGNQKFHWKYWHDRLEPFFPFIDNCYPISSGGFCRDRNVVEDLTLVPEEEEIPVRVTPVPKDLRGPRIIAIEPCCHQYVQQGIRDALYRIIESSALTKGHVNFRDQKINQSLAISSSVDRLLATIDLSDASDRVPFDLALEMFRSNPDLQGAIEACRSKLAKMPFGPIIGPLRKFASMGSALCFPVEAMYFFTIIVKALLEAKNLPVTRQNCFTVSRLVYVYGDDIIVPTDYVAVVLDHLRKYNCKVNTAKTFSNGYFRESCGVDSYLGVDITPTYIGTLLPKDKRDASRILSTVASGNFFYKKGYFLTAATLFYSVEKYLGPLPEVPENTAVIGRNHPAISNLPSRWNEDIQTLEYKVYVAGPVYRTDLLDGFPALQKCLLRLESRTKSSVSDVFLTREKTSLDSYLRIVEKEASIDVKHLERSAQHGAATIKRRWVPGYNLGFRY